MSKIGKIVRIIASLRMENRVVLNGGGIGDVNGIITLWMLCRI